MLLASFGNVPKSDSEIVKFVFTLEDHMKLLDKGLFSVLFILTESGSLGLSFIIFREHLIEERCLQ